MMQWGFFEGTVWMRGGLGVILGAIDFELI